MIALNKDIEHLESLYSGRRVFFGDLHNHSNSGGTSDGKYTLTQWREGMAELEMDFAAILDHKQVRHMYLPEWEDGVFIGGSEPGTAITDSNARVKEMHYNMIFENAAPLEELLAEFSEYEFEGGAEGHFVYPTFTRERMGQLIQAIKDKGGFFVYPHPKLIMDSDDPCDYWLADETGIEVFYCDMRSEQTEKNYKLWCDLLDKGKRLWACSGEDRHLDPTCNALTAIYAEDRKNKMYISRLREGDFVCGSVGIKMCIGTCRMGGICDFSGNKVIVSVNDFHPSVVHEGHTYKMVLIDNVGVVCEEKIYPGKPNTFAYPAEERCFYRVEVFDETENLRIAVGNPIWNK